MGVLVYSIASILGPFAGVGVCSGLLNGRFFKAEDFRDRRETLRFSGIFVVLAAVLGLLSGSIGTADWDPNTKLTVLAVCLIASMFFGAMAFPPCQALINNSMGRENAIWANTT